MHKICEELHVGRRRVQRPHQRKGHNNNDSMNGSISTNNHNDNENSIGKNTGNDNKDHGSRAFM